MIINLLDAGLSYVVSTGGKLLATLPIDRAVLSLKPLPTSTKMSPNTLNTLNTLNATSISNITEENIPNEFYPYEVRKRRRDLARIFRNLKKKGYPPVSLRVNTAFDYALTRLREHHGNDCWVGPELERVWRYMITTTPPQLLIFELWLGDILVAADFGHPVAGGRSFYVATRFFDRQSNEIKILQPGFLLAFSECKVLRDIGCYQWDLGGVDLCPLMRYKIDLTGQPIERPQALTNFLKCRQLGPSK
eukprot:CAMPEP_0182435452 /NCGR_PEP_ID=MMETSP1167-20130531/75862_1 /TAXON_ID=2988 /ORGANISM="Mallomonas Sp, Strain CCMP3275" /LENGTH=247 /DNA_ID=CAMNT_0024626523 /DNA_START=281 /DNA_END=1021 /DNA_ORIENTATION=+